MTRPPTAPLSKMVSPSETVTLATACPLDCPDSCSLEVSVSDGRVTRVGGSHLNPLTRGFLCSKVKGFDKHVYSRERILHPGLRQGPRGAGDFRHISWDEALDLVAERLRGAVERRGGESILPYCYGGSNGSLTQGTLDARLFYRLRASRLDSTVCASATSAAVFGMYGRIAGVAPEDYLDAELIVVWGANPSVSGIHLVPVIRAAQRRGARLVVVDPRRTPLVAQADLHLATRPGGDLPLALGVMNWLFENGAADLGFLAEHTTGWDELRRRAEPWSLRRAAEAAEVEVSELEAFAKLYAESSPAVIRCGWGPERNRNGGSAIASIVALPAVAGKFGVRGGGFTQDNSTAWRMGSDAIANEPEPSTRLLNMNRLGRDLLELDDPPIDVLFIYNSNPLVTVPEQGRIRRGLEREDLFTVVFDQVMTDTARYADVVLPATTFFEHRELRGGYGAMALHEMKPVIAPQGESRSNHDVFLDLCRRTGVARENEIETLDEVVCELLASYGNHRDLRRELDENGIAFAGNGKAPVQMVDALPKTADGKVHLVPEELDRAATNGLYTYQEDPATPRFPLALISPATNRTISSTMGQLYRKQVFLDLDAADAEARGIRSGDTVRVWNDVGEVHCKARIAGDLKPGLAYLPKGIWCHNTLNGATPNALVPATAADLGDAACFNDARVEVEKL